MNSRSSVIIIPQPIYTKITWMVSSDRFPLYPYIITCMQQWKIPGVWYNFSLPSTFALVSFRSTKWLWCTIFCWLYAGKHSGHLQLCLNQTPWYLLSSSPSHNNFNFLPSSLTEALHEACKNEEELENNRLRSPVTENNRRVVNITIASYVAKTIEVWLLVILHATRY